MKKLGLIGGIGPESTMLYYKKLVYGLQREAGHHFFPHITIESLNVYDVLSFCEKKDMDGLIQYLMKGINNLISSGSEIIALTGNTPHIVFDNLQRASSVPLISIVQSTKQAAENNQYTKIGLLGTQFTMQADFFKTPFIDVGIKILVPNENEQSIIAGKIQTELEQGLFLQETQEIFLQIIHRMQDEHGIEAIILGCTELPLLLQDISLPIPRLDTVELHIQELIKVIKT